MGSYAPPKIMKILDPYGIPREIEHLNAVQRLFTLKEKSGASPWPVIEECLKVWASTNPTEYRSFLFEVDDMRKTRRDKFASSDPKKDKVHGGIFRYTLDIPEKVMFMIRCIYDDTELVMDKEFFREWAKRFPRMKVAEKI